MVMLKDATLVRAAAGYLSSRFSRPSAVVRLRGRKMPRREVTAARIAFLRAEIAAGRYLTEKKLAAAIDEMLGTVSATD
jgi:hypothetical protein